MTRRPNLLVVLSDQHRFDWMHTVDPDLPIRTPVLDELARQGTSVLGAITPAPVCAPARACLATGTTYDAGPVVNNGQDLPTDAATYFRALRDEGGYHVSGTGKFDLHKATMDWNLDGSRCLDEWGLSAGIDNEGKLDAVASGWPAPRGPYMAFLHERGLAAAHREDMLRRKERLYADTAATPLPDDAYEDNWIAANARRLLAACPSDRPWHLVVNFAGPHDPMDVTAGMRARWDDVAFPPPHDTDEGPDDQQIRRNYAAMIENIDAHLGSLLELLDDRGETEDTVVVYSSDHGELLGDHGLWGKNLFFEPSIRVPLVVRGPGVAAGVTSDALVALEDVAATLLDLAEVPTPTSMTARSFRGLLEGRTATHREFVVSGLDRDEASIRGNAAYESAPGWIAPRRWRCLVTPTEKLVLRGVDDSPLLYDLRADPHETTDRADADPITVTRLTELLVGQVGADWRNRHDVRHQDARAGSIT